MYWRLNRIMSPVFSLGPGRRIGIWVQGCSIGCPGCVSKSLWPLDGGAAVDVAQLANQLAIANSRFDGITITGGEPFDQYEPLVAFCSYLRTKSELSICVYSGYTIEQLKAKFPDMLFAKVIDYLVDGPFIQSQQSDLASRGSSNQRLLSLNRKVQPLQDKHFVSSQWSVSVTKNSQIYLAGIPKKSLLSQMAADMDKVGVKMELE